MEIRQKKPKTKFQKVMKWIGIVELAILVIALVYLFTIRYPTHKFKNDDQHGRVLMIKGEKYEPFVSEWHTEDWHERNIGFAHNGGLRKVFTLSYAEEGELVSLERIYNCYVYMEVFKRVDTVIQEPSKESVGEIIYCPLNDRVVVEDHSLKDELVNSVFEFEESQEIDNITGEKLLNRTLLFYSKEITGLYYYVNIVQDKYGFYLLFEDRESSHIVKISDDIGEALKDLS